MSEIKAFAAVDAMKKLEPFMIKRREEKRLHSLVLEDLDIWQSLEAR